MYGTVEIILNIVSNYQIKRMRRKSKYIIILEKNQEEKIEGIIRSLELEELTNKNNKFEETIIIDFNSTDSTKEILDRICKKNKNIKVLSL